MKESRKYSAIVAARTGSSRLPGKALRPLKDIPMIVFLLRRLKTSKKINQIIFATTSLSQDDELASVVSNEGFSIFRGDRDDVVRRYVEAADKFDIQYAVRVTGDCPFINGESLDYCLDYCDTLDNFDLATTKGHFPVGIDYEIYNTDTMRHLHEGELTVEEREHLTLAIYNRSELFQIFNIPPPQDWPKDPSCVFTIDTPADYTFAKSLMESYNDIYFKLPELFQTATNIKRQRNGLE